MRVVLTCTTAIAFVFATAAAFAQTGGAGGGGANSGGADQTGGGSGGAGSGTNSGTAASGAGGNGGGTTGTAVSSTARGGGVSSNPGNAAGQVSGTPGGLSMGSEQAGQVTDRLRSITIEPLPGVDFEVREGLTVARNVTLTDCPEELGEIVAALKNCQLIRIKDQFMLVEPQTRKILEVIRVAS